MIKVHHKYSFLFLSLFLFVKGFSQEKFPPFGMEINAHFGSIIPHRPIINSVIGGHTQAYELSFVKSTLGNKDWQQAYLYPKLGVSLIVMDFGNTAMLGMGYSIFPNVEFTLIKKTTALKLKLGYGISYIDKPFNRETNVKNIAIGSRFNFLIYTGLNYFIKLNDAFKINTGISLIHYSNGSFERPNLGLNIFSIKTGVSYHFGNKMEKKINELNQRHQRWNQTVILGAGLKEIPPAEGPKYFVSSYSFNMIKTRSEKSSFGFGANIFYNTSLPQLIENDGKSNKEFDNVRFGLAGIYSFDFNRVSLLVEMGAYLFSNYKGNGVIYHRISTRFNVSDHILINLGLKTHYAVADFIEVGIGYNFNK